MPEQAAQEIVQKALFELELMRGNSLFDYGKLKRILEGKA
jgi:hypothetical protein